MNNTSMSVRHRLLGLLLAALIGFSAALPLVYGLSKGIDTLFHLFRLVQVDTLIQNGVLFSRWSPDLVYGYGYPLFNYYAPLSYYFAELFHLLGLNLVNAFIVTYVVALIGASVFMYMWVRDLFGETAALAAAAFYVLSPYIMNIALIRGALAEQVALALLPLILWAFYRLLVANSRVYAALGSLAFAGLILTHNITALIFTPVLLAYILVVAYSRQGSGFSWKRLINRSTVQAYWLLLLGLGMAAFYWLPALLERDLVQITQAYGPQVFNYDLNFLKFGELLALPFEADMALVNPEIPITISLITMIAGIFGVIGSLRFRGQKERMTHVWFALLVSLGSILMTLTLSTPLWELFSLLQMAQFPWRFLGVTGLFIAFLAGVGIANVEALISSKLENGRNLAWVITALFIGAVAIYIIPWQFVDYYPSQPLDIDDSQQFERDSGYIGTTSTGEYLPVFVQELPSDELRNLNSSERLQPESLPKGAQILSASYRPLDYELETDSYEPFIAVFNTFYFEGWQAKIDGNPANIMPTDPHGLISVQVPAGRHHLTIGFQSTTVRRLATFISLTSVVLFIASLILLFPRKLSETSLESSGTESRAVGYYAIIAAILLGILILRVVYLDESDSLFRQQRFDGQMVNSLDNSINVNFDNQLILMGIDAPSSLESGGTADIVLYWRSPTQVERDYSVSISIVNHNNTVIAQHDNQHAGQIPTTSWSPDQYAQDEHQIVIPPGTPPDTYELLVSTYAYGQPDDRLDILDENMAPAGQTISVTTLNVDRPDQPASFDDIETGYKVDWPLDENIRLVGVSLPEHTINVGEYAYLRFNWLATGDPNSDVLARIGLVNADGDREQSEEVPLIDGYPTSLWQRGDVWVSEHRFLLDPGLSTAAYTFILETGAGDSYPLGTIDVAAPSREMAPPRFTHKQDTTFGDVGILEGYSLPTEVHISDTMPITLTWRSLGKTTTSFKSFVQLLAEDGRMVAGSDMIPGNWQRPTTGWIANEYITETHVLQLTPEIGSGTYRVLVGLYDPITMERLLSDQDEEGLQLTDGIQVMP